MRVWKATMPVRCIVWSRSVSDAEFWNSAFATMPEATQARQVRLWGQEGASYGQEAIPPVRCILGSRRQNVRMESGDT